ncbi:hypothetical protein FKP32DRAFT_235901 [Trametes sanguinea]|nr:hypothetical protein FKP32DRAFT_235901 [Trametes sanguinea]
MAHCMIFPSCLPVLLPVVLEKLEFDLAACYSIYALHSHYVRYLCKLSTLPIHDLHLLCSRRASPAFAPQESVVHDPRERTANASPRVARSDSASAGSILPPSTTASSVSWAASPVYGLSS